MSNKKVLVSRINGMRAMWTPERAKDTKLWEEVTEASTPIGGVKPVKGIKAPKIAPKAAKAKAVVSAPASTVNDDDIGDLLDGNVDD